MSVLYKNITYQVNLFDNKRPWTLRAYRDSGGVVTAGDGQ